MSSVRNLVLSLSFGTSLSLNPVAPAIAELPESGAHSESKYGLGLKDLNDDVGTPTTFPPTCVSPATCKAPAAAKFQKVLPVQSRQQWEESGGFCGSLSIQASAMAFGAYISQDKVRKAAPKAPGHGSRTEGYEILHTNIGQALDNLKLTHDDWDYTQPLPQTEDYLAWLKKHLAKGEPVVWMIMCKGDSHDVYGIANYDHVEPVFGIFSNHSLEDPVVYADDVLVHGADYGANGLTEGPFLYRRFDTLSDTKEMNGNCSDAIPGPGHNEYYPCVPSDGKDWGFAITGVAHPSAKDVPVTILVDQYSEPDVREFQKPVELNANVTVHGLTTGSNYRVYRWDSTASVPTNGNYQNSRYAYHYDFAAADTTHVFADPHTILSSGVAYYRAVEM